MGQCVWCGLGEGHFIAYYFFFYFGPDQTLPREGFCPAIPDVATPGPVRDPVWTEAWSRPVDVGR